MSEKQLGGGRSYISRILIEGLFGEYSYDLRPGVGQDNKLLILYGDNGSGKTTILRLVFHLLSHIDNAGHKTFVAQAPFRKLVVYIGENTKVVAERPRGKILGSYRAYVRRSGRTLCSIQIKTSKDNVVNARRLGFQAEVSRFLKALAGLNIAMFYVTDDRELLTNASTPGAPEVEKEIRREIMLTTAESLERVTRPKLKQIDSALDQALKHAADWTKEQALKGSTQGDTDANSIYSEIIKRLIASPKPAPRFEERRFRTLVAVLEQQATRSVEFARFGLPSPRNIDQLANSLKKTRRGTETVYKIVEPFVDGIKAKLDALQEVQDSISTFVITLNSFFVDKTVAFDLSTGITVTAVGGKGLSPRMLSSGEKQLLLLFCNTLISRSEDTLFMIDEPEISLNVKWQRKLISSLVSATRKRNIQFILATHSFELLAPYSRRVLRLENRKNGKKNRASKADPTRDHSSA